MNDQANILVGQCAANLFDCVYFAWVALDRFDDFELSKSGNLAARLILFDFIAENPAMKNNISSACYLLQ